MGFWDSVKKGLSDIAETPNYWYNAGKEGGLKGGILGEGRRVVYAGQVINDLPAELRDAYRRGYADGVREREEG
jgi:hypothetical protein